MEKRENGYHDLETLFYPLQTPFDILDITEENSSGNITEEIKETQKTKEPKKNLSTSLPLHEYAKNIKVQCKTKGIDLNDNTLTKAYILYAQATNFAPKIQINLIKGIPHGAGLGGGSSDAAALLTYLQQKNPSPISGNKLNTLAAKIGADVPFFLINTPCKAKGIGEILEPVALKLEKYFLVLVSPCIQINTKWAFLKLDEEKKDLTAFQAFDKNHRSCFLKYFFWENDFEAPVFSEYPFLGEIKGELIKNGASVGLLSGSGSSLFGLFRSLEKARQATQALKHIFEGKNVDIYDPIEIK